MSCSLMVELAEGSLMTPVLLLIHEADPQSLPVVIAIFTKFQQVRIVIATGGIVEGSGRGDH